MSVDRDTKKLRVLLTSGRGGSPAGITREQDEQREDRNQLLLGLSERGMLVPDKQARGFEGQRLRGAITATTHDEVLRIQNTGAMLHIAREA